MGRARLSGLGRTRWIVRPDTLELPRLHALLLHAGVGLAVHAGVGWAARHTLDSKAGHAGVGCAGHAGVGPAYKASPMKQALQ